MDVPADAPQVAVVTDSTADIPDEIARRLGIAVVPLTVHFGAESYRDGVDLTPEQFWAKLAAAPTLPTTSQATAGAFEAAYRPLIEAGRSIISIHISAKLSGTLQSAQLAAQSFPSDRIVTLDSGSVAMALGLQVIAAAEAARAGKSLAEIADLVRSMAPRTGIICALDTLENLRRGGRIGRAGAFIGALLNIKPIIQVRDGEVVPLERVRTKGKALQRLAELARAEAPFERFAVAHGHDAEAGRQLYELLRPVMPAGDDVIFTEIGPVLGTHAGPGVVGFLYVKAA